MLAVQHVADHPDTPRWCCSRRISAGTSIVAHASKVGLLGGERIEEVQRRGAPNGREGRAKELMLLPGWWYVITAKAIWTTPVRCPNVLALRRASHARCSISAATRKPPTFIRRGLRGALRWAVRGAHRERLRSFLWRREQA